jgi:hypothetical protein
VCKVPNNEGLKRGLVVQNLDAAFTAGARTTLGKATGAWFGTSSDAD